MSHTHGQRWNQRTTVYAHYWGLDLVQGICGLEHKMTAIWNNCDPWGSVTCPSHSANWVQSWEWNPHFLELSRAMHVSSRHLSSPACLLLSYKGDNQSLALKRWRGYSESFRNQTWWVGSVPYTQKNDKEAAENLSCSLLKSRASNHVDILFQGFLSFDLFY